METSQESSVEMAIALCFFFIIMTSIFIAVAVFLPEWVGIAGKKSHEVTRAQQGEETTDSTPSTDDDKA